MRFFLFFEFLLFFPARTPLLVYPAYVKFALAGT